MFPASVWMAIQGPGGIVLEDRVTVAHVMPLCQKKQLSYVTKSSIAPDGSLTVSWTRPLIAPPSSGQPSIVPGNVSMIGAMFQGPPLDLRPCEAAGLPLHTALGVFTVELLPASSAPVLDAPALAPSLATPAPTAPPAGLIVALPVCAITRTNFARLLPSGAETYYGVAEAPAYLGVTSVDPQSRRLYSLAPNYNGATFALSVLDIDSGALLSTCLTSIMVPSSGSFAGLGLAWDARNGSAIVSACTDVYCAGYVAVMRLDPSSCAAALILKVPTDPAAAVLPGAAAFDAASGTFVMSITQSLGGTVSLVLIGVDMETGAVLGTYNEGIRGLDVVALAAEEGRAGSFVGVEVDPANTVAFVRYNAIANRLTRAPPLKGCTGGAVAGSAALDAQSGVLYVLTPDAPSGSARVLGIHTANGTLASVGIMPGNTENIPGALLFA